jgi:AcrR family transcriptional regulator
MGRFSDEERARIRSQLLEEANEQFSHFGFERTRIRDVTDAVGIGTSTFYQFYDSKEQLYVEVLTFERRQLQERLDEAVAACDSTREEVQTVLRTLLAEVRTNPLISRLIIGDELRTVQRELSEADRESAANVDDAYVDAWTEDPAFRYDDPDVVRGIFQSLVFTTRVEDLADEEEFDVAYETIEDGLIETIVDGLFSAPGTEDPAGAE